MNVYFETRLPKDMTTFIFRLFYIPFRFGYIVTLSTWMGLAYLVSGRKKYGLGTFYQKLFDRLGGTFIKMGQALALRQDILPVEHCEALSNLLDAVDPFPTEKAVKILERELGAGVDKFFKSFPDKPFASASFSQVYKVEDHKGRLLAVKIMRPNIEHLVFADTFFLKVTSFFMTVFGIGTRLGVNKVIAEVIDVLRQELNYPREAEMVNLFHIDTQDIGPLVVPRAFKNLSGKRVITMDFLEGISLRETLTKLRANPGKPVNGIDGNPIDLVQTCESIYEITLRCIFEKNFFHGDPHPGNIILMPYGRIGLIDFGICGTLSLELKIANFRYMDALSSGNVEYAAKLFTEMVTPNPDADLEGLKREMTFRLAVWRAATSNPDSTFAEKSSGVLVNDSISLARKYSYSLSKNILLYYKALLTIDHAAIELNPKYDSLEQADKYVRESTLRRISKFAEMDSLRRIGNSMLHRVLEIAENPGEFFERIKKFIEREEKNAEKEVASLFVRKISSKVLIAAGFAFSFVKIAFAVPALESISVPLALVISTAIVFLGVRLSR